MAANDPTAAPSASPKISAKTVSGSSGRDGG